MGDDEKDFQSRRPQSQLAENFARQCDPIDEARYENARWWRNLNRVMSVIGALLIAAIVSFFFFFRSETRYSRLTRLHRLPSSSYLFVCATRRNSLFSRLCRSSTTLFPTRPMTAPF